MQPALVRHFLLHPNRIPGVFDFIKVRLRHSSVERMMQHQHQPSIERVKQHAVPAVIAYQDSILPPRPCQFPMAPSLCNNSPKPAIPPGGTR